LRITDRKRDYFDYFQLKASISFEADDLFLSERKKLNNGYED
jgi:hypothetical protein